MKWETIVMWLIMLGVIWLLVFSLDAMHRAAETLLETNTERVWDQ